MYRKVAPRGVSMMALAAKRRARENCTSSSYWRRHRCFSSHHYNGKRTTTPKLVAPPPLSSMMALVIPTTFTIIGAMIVLCQLEEKNNDDHIVSKMQTLVPSCATGSTTDCLGFHVKEAYEIQEILGEGAFGKVYSAIRRLDGKHIALKSMAQKFSGSDDFEREINALRILAEPGHKSVCKLYDQHQNDEYYFLAMEFINGGELFEHLINNGAFSEKDASEFLRQFADALEYIHSKGLVHADLKPENLMLTTSTILKTNDNNNNSPPSVAELKVVDFGCTVDPTTIDLQNFNESGTPAYSSPEQNGRIQESQSKKKTKNKKRKKKDAHDNDTNKNKLPTPASDMFAAGIIMYILLTGSHPFDPYNNRTDEEVAGAIGRCSFKNIFDERTDHLSPASIQLLEKLLSPDRKYRMTATEMKSDPWIVGDSASSTHLGIDTKLKQFWQKRLRAAILKKFGDFSSSNGGNNSKNTPLTEARLRKIFKTMDLDGNGEISMEELKAALGQFQDDIQDLLNSADADGNGSLDYEEFKIIMLNAFNYRKTKSLQQQDNDDDTKKVEKVLQDAFQTKTVSRKRLREVFDSMDIDGNGTLEMWELRHVLKTLLGMDDNAISAWADVTDADLSGHIDFDEFCRSMMHSEKKKKK